MAVPTFVAIGSAVAGTSPRTATPPTHQADDILVACAVGTSAVPDTSTSGWTSIGTTPTSVATAFDWKRATGAGTAGAEYTVASGNVSTVCFAIRGALTGGTPYEDATLIDNSDTFDSTPNSSSVDSTVANCLAVAVMAVEGFSTLSSGLPPSGWTADTPALVTDGSNIGDFAVISKTQASAGNVPAVTILTLAAGARGSTLTLLFKENIVNVTVTGVVADALGDGPLPTPALTLLPDAGRSNPMGRIPVPNLAVTAGAATGLADAPAPTLEILARTRPYADVFLGV